MFETGYLSSEEIGDNPRGLTRATAMRAHVRNGLGKRLGGSVAACVFMLSLFAPISIDVSTGDISVNAAQAGNGDGNSGKGKGNGGPNGKNPGVGSGDDDGDDGDDGDAPPTIPVTEEYGDQNSGTDAAADMAEVDFAEAIDAIAGSPAEGPMAGTPATTLPTISQVFAMGDEATVSAEDELELIANGWGAAN